jgi:hypothetical protein
MTATMKKRERQAKQNLKEATAASMNGLDLLGEIITWEIGTAASSHAKVVAALKSADLDESMARELLPRHAFSRACKKLAEARIIRQVKDDGGFLDFQFTKESLSGDRWDYAFETMLRLNKQTGDIDCSIAALAKHAKDELDRCMEARTASDITAIVQRFFDREADLFPIRKQGGAYFVPAAYVDLVAKIESFLRALGGSIERFPVPKGTQAGDRSVKDAVANGLAGMIEEHKAAVKDFGEDTREDTLTRAAERVKKTRFKIDAYKPTSRRRQPSCRWP